MLFSFFFSTFLLPKNLSTDDISKLPRLPGDGAQAETESNFDESTTTGTTMSCRPTSTQNQKDSNNTQMETDNREGKHWIK